MVNHVFPAWDFISGQMIAIGLLAAERHRRMTGEGQLVRLALKDVALAMLGNFGMIAEVMVNDADRRGRATTSTAPLAATSRRSTASG
jgi:2-methylfumaryl-CoA isomerase